jgi:putative protease
MAAQTIELLAPAGSPEALDAAVGEGADAVYLGLKNFNARMRSANFTYAQFEGALRALRRMGKKLYVTVNTVFEQREADRMYQFLKYLAAVGPDALIVQDFGVVAMVRAEFPSLKLHASTQMNIASGRGANALSGRGVSRVVLARELSLTELRNVRAGTNMELEVFVHGALCVSASGLCLFSSYLGGKSANRGMCTQACRRLYHREGEVSPPLHPAAKTTEYGFSEELDSPICFGGRVPLPPLRGSHPRNAPAPTGGYYFSPGDLQLLDRLPDLAAAGINALKIEGRMKSADYVGAVVSAYRLVLDAIADGDDGEQVRRSIQRGQEILRNDFARSKTRFYFDAPPPPAVPGIDWLNPVQDGGTGISLGALLKVKDSGGRRRGLVSPERNGGPAPSPAAGDTIRLHRVDDSERVSHKLKFAEESDDGYWISIPEGFEPGDRVYLIQTRAMSKRYEPLVPRGAAGGGRGPGREKAPFPEIQRPQKETGTAGKTKPGGGFPEGLYVAVSRAEDLYIVQSVRPVRVMLSYTRKTAARLLAENKESSRKAAALPFRPAEIMLVLDPFFPEAAAETMADEIGRLVEKGYRQFVLNNPGHFSLFRGAAGRPAVQLVAGPWLYMFNRWSLSFIASWGVDGFVSPLENNRQNLERTLGTGRLRPMFFIPVFVRPPLFRVRADLGSVYDFDTFSDNRDESFSLVAGPEGSLVIPEIPFSIIDKIPFLREAGFGRFIIDLGGPALKKKNYKDLMRAAAGGIPLPHISRFNWKDGFYQPAEKE